MSVDFLPQPKNDMMGGADYAALDVVSLGRRSQKKGIYKYAYANGVKCKRQLRRIQRRGKKVVLKLTGGISDNAVSVAKKIKQGVLDKKNEALELFRKSYWDLQLRKKEILDEKSKDSISAKMQIFASTLYAFFQPITAVFLGLLNYVAPVAAAAMFILTIQFFTNMNFGLQVGLHGENLGYIENEEVFQKADKLMQSRINYADYEEALYSTPTFKVVFVSDDEFLESAELCDKIILSSGSTVTPASGLYIDGAFMGATTQSDLVNNSLQQLLANSLVGLEDEQVEFTQKIEMIDGLYLPSSMMEDTQSMLNMITGESQAMSTYVLEEGDTPSGVAQKLGVSVDAISHLNPTLSFEDDFPQGKEIIVESSKPFLTVVSKGKITFEETIAFESVTEEDDTITKGVTEVVQEGEDGIVTKMAEVSYVNGVEVERNVYDEQVTKEPVEEKIVVGTKVIQKAQPKKAAAPATAASAPNQTAAASASTSSVPAGTGQFMWPVASGGKITCGWLGYYGHRAIDIQSFGGDTIVAADSGTVVKVVYGSTGYGYHIVIDHGNGYRTLYAHMSNINVSQGQSVSKGQAVGSEGRTGRASGIHLHFEIIKNGVQVNPTAYF